MLRKCVQHSSTWFLCLPSGYLLSAQRVRVPGLIVQFCSGLNMCKMTRGSPYNTHEVTIARPLDDVLSIKQAVLAAFELFLVSQVQSWLEWAGLLGCRNLSKCATNISIEEHMLHASGISINELLCVIGSRQSSCNWSCCANFDCLAWNHLSCIVLCFGIVCHILCLTWVFVLAELVPGVCIIESLSVQFCSGLNDMCKMSPNRCSTQVTIAHRWEDLLSTKQMCRQQLNYS